MKIENVTHVYCTQEDWQKAATNGGIRVKLPPDTVEAVLHTVQEPAKNPA